MLQAEGLQAEVSGSDLEEKLTKKKTKPHFKIFLYTGPKTELTPKKKQKHPSETER